jgi:hypothetical protein
MIERAEGENKKIEAKTLNNKYYWAIQYMKDLDMDGNILYFIESAKELLPGYIKTSKGLILPREIYYTLTNIKGLEKEIGVVKKEKSKLMLCGLILPLWVLLLFVGSYLVCMFISVLYMYAFAFSSLSMFSIFLDMQYSPYSLLYVENAVSTAHLLP